MMYGHLYCVAKGNFSLLFKNDFFHVFIHTWAYTMLHNVICCPQVQFVMSSPERDEKRRKEENEYVSCIICSKKSTLLELSTPIDNNSWKSLCNAAVLRNYQPILQLTNGNANELPKDSIYYQKNVGVYCRCPRVRPLVHRSVHNCLYRLHFLMDFFHFQSVG